MSHQKKRKKIPVRATIIVFAVIVILGIIFLIASGGKIYKSSKRNSEEIEKNVAALKELETRTPAESGAYVPPAEFDLDEEQKKILETPSEDFNADQIRSYFQGSVILGDSITMAAEEYGYLGFDVICAEIGAGPLSAEGLFEDAIARNPAVLFVVFGSNDISNYNGDPALFIEQYGSMAERLKTALPNTAIYMHGILPIQEGIANEEGFEYRTLYNDALEKYCAEHDGIYYINADFILDQKPELYDADGIHPVSDFYLRWLTYLADVSGLSGGNQDLMKK